MASLRSGPYGLFLFDGYGPPPLARARQLNAPWQRSIRNSVELGFPGGWRDQSLPADVLGKQITKNA
jgi:hypothetical protein